jgi:hypothetical protein
MVSVIKLLFYRSDIITHFDLLKSLISIIQIASILVYLLLPTLLNALFCAYPYLIIPVNNIGW